MNEKDLKKDVKMRGMKTLRFLIWILGRLHGRKGIITDQDGECYSSFINTKIKDYQSYAARLWMATAEEMQKGRKMMIHLLVELKQVERQLDNMYQSNTSSEPATVEQLRKNKVINSSRNALEERKKMILQHLPELRESMNISELVTEELLINGRRKAESLLQTYLQGARKYLKEDVRINLPEDESSREVYERRKRRLEENCEKCLEGGESYVQV